MDETPKKCPYRRVIDTSTYECIKTRPSSTGDGITTTSTSISFHEKHVFDDCYAEQCRVFDIATRRCGYEH